MRQTRLLQLVTQHATTFVVEWNYKLIKTHTPTGFDCKTRHLAMEYARKIQPFRGKSSFDYLADVLNSPGGLPGGQKHTHKKIVIHLWNIFKRSHTQIGITQCNNVTYNGPDREFHPKFPTPSGPVFPWRCLRCAVRCLILDFVLFCLFCEDFKPQATNTKVRRKPTTSNKCNNKKVFYVATDGSDTNPGTLASPFATVDKAVAATGNNDWINRLFCRVPTTSTTTTAEHTLHHKHQTPNNHNRRQTWQCRFEARYVLLQCNHQPWYLTLWPYYPGRDEWTSEQARKQTK